MRLHPWRFSAKILWLLIVPMTLDAVAISLSELRRDERLTPETFAARFVDFNFKFRAEVQPWEKFVKARSGDCDDFATLADSLLRERGYTTRLLSIRMSGVVHVVCYVKEAGGYLDYNYRQQGRIVPCADNPETVAAKVAQFYDRAWTSVSEFTFSRGLKRLVRTVKPSGTDAPVVIAQEVSASRSELEVVN